MTRLEQNNSTINNCCFKGSIKIKIICQNFCLLSVATFFSNPVQKLRAKPVCKLPKISITSDCVIHLDDVPNYIINLRYDHIANNIVM